VSAAAIVDIDGTLVDSNYHHALAWWRAFRLHDVEVPIWICHRHVGMGGDKLVAAVAGDDVERTKGDDLRESEATLFATMIDEVTPLPGAVELLDELERRGLQVVLASSAKAHEADHYLDLHGARELVHAWTTSADVEETKPEPDLVEVALAKLPGADGAAMIGDSAWDFEAAGRAGIPGVGLLTGGFGAQELLDAGASAVYASCDELRRRLDETPLGRG
jgi:phosphoglycolate phosphatase-like HAD superfamily hydrolase